MSWEPYAKGMTHGFVLEFRCQEDLDYYLTEDPVHLAFSKAAGPLIEDSVVVGRFCRSHSYYLIPMFESFLIKVCGGLSELLMLFRYP